MRDNSPRLRTIFRPVVNSIAGLLARLKLTPNMISVFGALLATTTPFLMADGEYIGFGAIVFLVGIMDGVDGAVARLTNKVTKWGGFLDSLLDRYGDSIILLAYLFNPVTAPLGQVSVLGMEFRIWICIAAMGSLMVSYARAKSEAIRVKKIDIGVAARSERLLLLSITGILGVLYEYITVYGLIIIAVLANITALQRVARTHGILRKKEETCKPSSLEG